MQLNAETIGNAIPQAVLCCPAESIAELDYNYRIKNPNSYYMIRKEIYSNDDDFDKIAYLCELKYSPTAYISQTPVDEVIISHIVINYNLYRIGYKVRNGENNIFDNRLPKLKKKSDIFTDLEILYDGSEVRTKLVKYKLLDSKEFDWKIIKCTNFDIGKDKLGVVIENAYSETQQNIILHDAIFIEEIMSPSDEEARPTTFVKPSEGTRISIDQYTYVKKWLARNEQGMDKKDFLIPQLLAPEYHFSDESLALPTCSFLNTAPMWHSIAKDGWSKLQRFLPKVANRVGPLTVIIGTHGVLTVHFYDSAGGVEEKKLYLLTKPRKTVPVPEAFWTVVMFHLPANEEWPAIDYGIILVTGNRKFIPIDEICDTVKCQTVGWHGVNVGVQGPPTQCCRFTQKNLRKMGIKVPRMSETDLAEFNLYVVAKGRMPDGSVVTARYADGLFNEMVREEREDFMEIV